MTSKFVTSTPIKQNVCLGNTTRLFLPLIVLSACDFFFIITLLGGSANCQSFELIVIVPNIDGEFKQPVLFKNSYVQFMSQKK